MMSLYLKMENNKNIIFGNDKKRTTILKEETTVKATEQENDKIG